MKKLTVLAVGPHYPANSWRFLVDAFEHQGHQVFRVGPTYNDHFGLIWPEKDKANPDILLPRKAPLWNLDQFVDLCTDTIGTPDVLLVSEETYQTDIIPTDKVPTALISYDSWQKCFDRYTLFVPTVAYITQPLGNRYEKRTEEDPRWRFLGPAYAPWVHARLVPEDRYNDFVLLATMYGERGNLCKALAKNFNVISGCMTTDAYVTAYNRSLCTLHNPGYSEVKWRFVEAAAMGCVSISWYTPLFDRLGYVAGIHYAPIYAPEDGVNLDPWPTTGDLIRVIGSLKEDKNYWHYLSTNAQKLTEERHSYYHRVGQIIADMGFA